MFIKVIYNIRILSVLRGQGIRIAMDDFGTGYSSLSYLSRLPLDTLKIDRSFISGIVEIPSALNIVTIIINLAHSLGLQVVAEGVETLAQAEMLKTLKCDQAQGYLYSKPVPAEQIQLLLPARTAG